MIQQKYLFLSLILTLPTAFLMGILIERLTLRPLIGQPIFATVMMTLAMAQFLQGMTILTWGAYQRPLPEILPLQPLIIGTIRLRLNLVIAFAVAMLGFGIFAIFFRYTKAGLAMRAAAEDHRLAQSVGLSVRRIFGLAWAIASVIAMTGGVLLGNISGVDLNLSSIGFKAFPAVLFGGLESIPGALIGGLAVGIIENLVAGLPADPTVRSWNLGEIAPYVFMLLVLLFRPEGLFGLKRIERI